MIKIDLNLLIIDRKYLSCREIIRIHRKFYQGTGFLFDVWGGNPPMPLFE